jgi:hypothetical protein
VPSAVTTFVFILAIGLITASILCAVGYGVAVRDYGQRQELGYGKKEPYCIAAVREADRFLAVGALAYLMAIAILARIVWFS